MNGLHDVKFVQLSL